MTTNVNHTLKLWRQTAMTLIVMLSMSLISFAKDKGDTSEYKYNIENGGTGTQGTYLVKVTVITKNKKLSDEEIGRNAVHGVLFKGFPGQRPLAGSALAESQNADFFKEFFKINGPAKNYVQVVNSSRQVKKVGKLYHVATTVTVSKDQLRRDLENAGVIKGLNSAF